MRISYLHTLNSKIEKSWAFIVRVTLEGFILNQGQSHRVIPGGENEPRECLEMQHCTVLNSQLYVRAELSE